MRRERSSESNTHIPGYPNVVDVCRIGETIVITWVDSGCYTVKGFEEWAQGDSNKLAESDSDKEAEVKVREPHGYRDARSNEKSTALRIAALWQQMHI